MKAALLIILLTLPALAQEPTTPPIPPAAPVGPSAPEAEKPAPRRAQPATTADSARPAAENAAPGATARAATARASTAPASTAPAATAPAATADSAPAATSPAAPADSAQTATAPTATSPAAPAPPGTADTAAPTATAPSAASPAAPAEATAPSPASPRAADVAATGPAHYQRYDHRGALGLLLATTVERKDAGAAGQISDAGWRVGAEVGGTYPVSYSGNEFKLALRGLFGGPAVDTALYLGFRGYFDLSFWRANLEQWKTFFDLDLCGHLTPAYEIEVTDGLAGTLSTTHVKAPLTATAGPRVGVGVQFDFLPVAGAYLAIAGQLGFGTGVRFGAELLLGLQFRSYLLE